jgi:hypothetical protein
LLCVLLRGCGKRARARQGSVLTPATTRREAQTAHVKHARCDSTATRGSRLGSTGCTQRRDRFEVQAGVVALRRWLLLPRRRRCVLGAWSARRGQHTTL